MAKSSAVAGGDEPSPRASPSKQDDQAGAGYSQEVSVTYILLTGIFRYLSYFMAISIKTIGNWNGCQVAMSQKFRNAFLSTKYNSV